MSRTAPAAHQQRGTALAIVALVLTVLGMMGALLGVTASVAADLGEFKGETRASLRAVREQTTRIEAILDRRHTSDTAQR